jgi:hypothetical protein
MQTSLATSAIRCAQLLEGLSVLHHDAQCSERSAVHQLAIADQSARFQVWAGNLGAFQRLPASASLDYRLRESPKIAAQIYELLQDLQGTTDDGAIHMITQDMTDTDLLSSSHCVWGKT